MASYGMKRDITVPIHTHGGCLSDHNMRCIQTTVVTDVLEPHVHSIANNSFHHWTLSTELSSVLNATAREQVYISNDYGIQHFIFTWCCHAKVTFVKLGVLVKIYRIKMTESKI